MDLIKKEYIREYQKEYQGEYYKNNREEIAIKNKIYYQINRDEIAITNKINYEIHKKKVCKKKEIIIMIFDLIKVEKKLVRILFD